MPNIQFVDINDEPIGGGTKDEAFEKGIRRRVSRVFLVNGNREVLLQKRSDTVPAGPGLWDDSVAGHVDEGETYDEAAVREMREEMGISGVVLTEVGYYYFEDSVEQNGWKGFQRIYVGRYDGELHPNPAEVAEVKWLPPSEIDAWMESRPEEFMASCIRSYKMVRRLL